MKIQTFKNSMASNDQVNSKMPGLIERPKMSLAMWGALKRHIMKQREKKKQEQEADAAVEQLKKEQEKKRKQDEMTIEDFKDQIANLSQQLSTLKDDKHQLFTQLKKVLHEDEKRRTKEANDMIAVGHPGYHGIAVPPQQALYMLNNNQILAGRSPVMYKVVPPPSQNVVPQKSNSLHRRPQLLGNHLGLKRTRSPSPPPPSSAAYQSSYNYKTSHYSSQRNQGSPFYPHTSSGASFGGFPSGQYPVDQPSGSKHHSSAPFHLPHLSQQGFVSSLPPQLEHQTPKSSYSEEKYYVQTPTVVPMRGSPAGQSLITIQPQQKSGGITSGYPVRSQPSTSGSNTTQNSYVSQPRHNYQGGPPSSRYY